MCYRSGMRILVVEDEPEVSDFLLRVLRDAAWAADAVGAGEAALFAAAANDYDLIVLDVGLPDLDGFEVCRRLRAEGNVTPVLVLTARNAVNDRVRGLDAGADDYLAKPFAVSELLARLRALARRPVSALEPVLRLADLSLDPAQRRAMRGGQELTLTAREYALLEYLLRNPRRVVTRGQILEHVWDDNFDPVANAVDVLVGRVRRKVDRPGVPALLHTVRGAGYLLSDRAPAAADAD
ncbi:MAG: response regulator transcription factor [Gemmatimonadaceae bacterium]